MLIILYRATRETMIKLYGMGSPNVVKVLIMLEELGYDYALHRLDLVAGEQNEDAFRRLNPNGKVPVLVDVAADEEKDLVVFESGAILIYLAERAGQLLAGHGAERAAALQWLFFQASAAGPYFGQAIHFTFAQPDAGYGKLRFNNELARLIKVIEFQLSTSRFIAGEQYSIADIALWPWIRTLQKFFPAEADRLHIRKWFEEIASHPAVIRAVAQADEMSLRDKAAMKAASKEQLDRYFGRAVST
jgi:GST-like protein